MFRQIAKCILIIFLTACSEISIRKGINDEGYYFEGEVVDNMLHGRYQTYYKSGNLRTLEFYIKGEKTDDLVLYYDTSETIIQKKLIKRNDDLFDTIFYFAKQGWVTDYWVFDKSRELIDFRFFYSRDSQDLDGKHRSVLFYPSLDTINYGSPYQIYATLSNRHYNSVEGMLGDLDDKSILLENPKLPKLNHVTLIVYFAPEKIKRGNNCFSGALINIDSNIRNPLEVTFFEKSFYAK